MKKTIIIRDDRELICRDDDTMLTDDILGVTGENNATILDFAVPERINDTDVSEFEMVAVFSGTYGSFKKIVENNTLSLTSDLTQSKYLDVSIQFVKDDEVKWESFKKHFYFADGNDDSGVNVIDTAKAEQREADRSELAGVVTELTGNDFTAAEWDRLMGVTAELPIKSEQDIIDLRDCTDLKYAFERCTTLPSILLDTFNLETDSETAEKKYIRLPYLNTKNMVFNIWSPKPSAFRISKSIVECGFDVSSCKTISSTQNSPFAYANYLQRTKLTGIRSLNYMRYMFYNAVGLVEIELGDSGTAPETLNTLYWQAAFSGCRNLQAITGDPLDMSRGDYYSDANNELGTQTFYNCESLRYVRFKVGTICHDLDLSYCPALIKKYEATTDDPGTLLSIINGVRDYTGAEDPITIKFSTFVKSYLSSWRCTIDEQTGLYVYSDRNSDNTMWTILTTVKGVVIS